MGTNRTTMKGHLVSLRPWLASLCSSLNEWLAVMSPHQDFMPMAQEQPSRDPTDKAHMAQRKLEVWKVPPQRTEQKQLASTPVIVTLEGGAGCTRSLGRRRTGPNGSTHRCYVPSLLHPELERTEAQQPVHWRTLCIFWHLYVGKPV